MESSGFRLKLFLLLFLSVMILGTVVFAYVENLDLLDAFYFSIVTVATVGYGDISPRTTEGKMLAIALIVTGVGTFLEVVAGITQVMLKRRDKEVRVEKLNMILGLFFSEIGTSLLKTLSGADPDPASLPRAFSTIGEWGDEKFKEEMNGLSRHRHQVSAAAVDLSEVKAFLEKKGDLLLRLLENPILLEHESFTELLRAIFHFRDELLNRHDLHALPAPDLKHLAGDMERIYRLLSGQWLIYMSHLRVHFPYLFSLARRTNPFDRSASATIRE
ncbi:MAG: potassium channel family protein [Syntrophobacteraceae bacterium]|jgi:hypothetical protein|nr:potassium channel family protein [Syntrophobacteraceae bacterium]